MPSSPLFLLIGRAEGRTIIVYGGGPSHMRGAQGVL